MSRVRAAGSLANLATIQLNADTSPFLSGTAGVRVRPRPSGQDVFVALQDPPLVELLPVCTWYLPDIDELETFPV